MSLWNGTVTFSQMNQGWGTEDFKGKLTYHKTNQH